MGDIVHQSRAPERLPQPLEPLAQNLLHTPGMRVAAAILILASLARAQFKSTASLVVVPTTVKDSKGRYIDGLSTEDLILYDNNVPQRIQMDWMVYPIDLVVSVQASDNSGAVIDKLGGSGILFTELVAADAGETAVISFSDEVRLHQDFTHDPDLVVHALRMLRKEGAGPNTLDALQRALTMLEHRPPGRRRIVCVIGERRDRSSQAKLDEVMQQVQRTNAAVYWLTFSPLLETYTVRPKTAEDLKPEAERIKIRKCPNCPAPDDTPVPADLAPLNLGLPDLLRLRKPDLSSLFTRTTGGRTLNFLRKNALEQAVKMMGEEVHRQYVLTFEPKRTDPGKYHAIRVVVKGRPDLEVKAREGYWAVP